MQTTTCLSRELQSATDTLRQQKTEIDEAHKKAENLQRAVEAQHTVIALLHEKKAETEQDIGNISQRLSEISGSRPVPPEQTRSDALTDDAVLEQLNDLEEKFTTRYDNDMQVMYQQMWQATKEQFAMEAQCAMAQLQQEIEAAKTGKNTAAEAILQARLDTQFSEAAMQRVQEERREQWEKTFKAKSATNKAGMREYIASKAKSGLSFSRAMGSSSTAHGTVITGSKKHGAVKQGGKGGKKPSGHARVAPALPEEAVALAGTIAAAKTNTVAALPAPPTATT